MRECITCGVMHAMPAVLLDQDRSEGGYRIVLTGINKVGPRKILKRQKSVVSEIISDSNLLSVTLQLPTSVGNQKKRDVKSYWRKRKPNACRSDLRLASVLVVLEPLGNLLGT